MIHFDRYRLRTLLRSAGAAARLGWTSSGPVIHAANAGAPWRAAGSCPLFIDAPDVVDVERVTGGGRRR